jgi:hypothetical protein
MNNMNKIKTLPVQRTRAHRVLFETGSPFKSRTVENKTRYQRNTKHRERPYDA